MTIAKVPTCFDLYGATEQIMG